MPMLLRRGVAPIAISAAIALVYWPGLYGFWGRDDFMQLAFARLVGSPWPLFVHDHYFPAPGSIFRPLGFASFWLWQALFGTDYFAHAFADMLLHVAVSLALYRVIRAGGLDRTFAALCTLFFALHPAVLGTALWWSVRFDLLASLFAFVAVRAALDHEERPRSGSLLLALVAVLAALLSKETALAAVVASGLVWLRWVVRDPAQRADAVRALAALASVTVFFLVWRWIVLGTAASGLAGDAPLGAAISKGVVAWLRYAAGYLTFWPRLGGAERLVIAAAAIALVACLVVAARRRDSGARSSANLLLCGLCLLAVPALLQAPVVALNAAPLRDDVSAVEAAMQSRLYYLSIGGCAIVLSVLVRWTLSRAPATRIPLALLLAAGACVLGAGARESASRYAERTRVPKAMAEAAAAAVDRLDLPAARCHVVLLGAEPPVEWSIYVSMDSVVKALSANLENVGRCVIRSDYATYFNLMDRSATPADAAPYEPRVIDGRALAWLRVGDVAAAYLDPPANIDPATIRDTFFLRYERGAFRDVTADVREGRLVVDLR